MSIPVKYDCKEFDSITNAIVYILKHNKKKKYSDIAHELHTSYAMVSTVNKKFGIRPLRVYKKKMVQGKRKMQGQNKLQGKKKKEQKKTSWTAK